MANLAYFDTIVDDEFGKATVQIPFAKKVAHTKLLQQDMTTLLKLYYNVYMIKSRYKNA